MFKRLREKLAASMYEKQLTKWQNERDEYEELLQFVRTYKGDPSSDVMLKQGEAVFAVVGGAALVEDRRGRGHWEGSSSSISIPIGSLGGRSVRYSAGREEGHYIQGTSTPTAIDTGTVYVTNQRVIFQGGKQTREYLWNKLIGVQHDDKVGKTAFSVSNRQKPLIILYGPKVSAWFDFRLGLALAHYRDSVPALVAQLEGQLADLDAHRPQPPPESGGSQGLGWWRLFRSLPRRAQIASWIGLTVLVLALIGSIVGEESGTGNAASASNVASASSPATTVPTAVAQTPPPTTEAPRPTPTTAPQPTPTTAPTVARIVHPGAFCSTAGARGVTSAGTPMICKLDSKGQRLRWSRA